MSETAETDNAEGTYNATVRTIRGEVYKSDDVVGTKDDIDSMTRDLVETLADVDGVIFIGCEGGRLLIPSRQIESILVTTSAPDA